MTNASPAKVLDFASFKSKKMLAGERKESLTDAFQIQTVSAKLHSTGKEQSSMQASPNSPSANVSGGDVNLNERIERIKASIGRINALMAELRQDKK